jgi:nitrogen fixation/metabolism regulation signal transduction histidine kinase
VAEGDLDTRVHIRVRDEMGDLARSFNEMVRQIKGSRERIAYLEKIGAWQEIARRLAHEIKNPLTPIQLAVQQLHRTYDGDDPRFQRVLQDACDIVSEEVEGLRRLVQAFSAFAKLPDVQPEPVELNALMDDFLKSRSEMEEMASVNWSPLEPAVTVLVDRMLIKHALFNLVENAVQAAREAGTLDQLVVTISPGLDRPRQWVSLTVGDNGPGMDRSVSARIFDPYFTTKEAGTGLGLAIVKKIILEHEGTVSVTSAPGQGARFTINLPLAE